MLSDICTVKLHFSDYYSSKCLFLWTVSVNSSLEIYHWLITPSSLVWTYRASWVKVSMVRCKHHFTQSSHLLTKIRYGRFGTRNWNYTHQGEQMSPSGAVFFLEPRSNKDLRDFIKAFGIFYVDSCCWFLWCEHLKHLSTGGCLKSLPFRAVFYFHRRRSLVLVKEIWCFISI